MCVIYVATRDTGLNVAEKENTRSTPSNKFQSQSKDKYHQVKYQSQSYKNEHKKSTKSKIDALQNTDSSEDDTYQRQFHSVTVNEKCMHSINAKVPRGEAYTVLNVKNHLIYQTGNTHSV